LQKQTPHTCALRKARYIFVGKANLGLLLYGVGEPAQPGTADDRDLWFGKLRRQAVAELLCGGLYAGVERRRVGDGHV
jgi:hypothetical protein